MALGALFFGASRPLSVLEQIRVGVNGVPVASARGSSLSVLTVSMSYVVHDGAGLHVQNSGQVVGSIYPDGSIVGDPVGTNWLIDKIKEDVLDSGQQTQFLYIAPSNHTQTTTSAMVVCSSDGTTGGTSYEWTASTGLQPATGTYASTGTGTATLTKTFTLSLTPYAAQTIYGACLASASGIASSNLGAWGQFSQTAVLSQSGDNVQIQYSLTVTTT